jgi:hypothetical protein
MWAATASTLLQVVERLLFRSRLDLLRSNISLLLVAAAALDMLVAAAEPAVFGLAVFQYRLGATQ